MKNRQRRAPSLSQGHPRSHREVYVDSVCDTTSSSHSLSLLRDELAKPRWSTHSLNSSFASLPSSIEPAVEHTLSVILSEVVDPDVMRSGLIGTKVAMSPLTWMNRQIEERKQRTKVVAWWSRARLFRNRQLRLSPGERSLLEAAVKLRSRFLLQWRSRWAILTPHYLYVFRKQEDASDAQETSSDCIALSTIVEMTLAGKLIRIRSQTRVRPFVFHFQDATCAARWAELIRDFLEARGRRSVAFRSSARCWLRRNFTV